MIIYLYDPDAKGGAETIAAKIMHGYIGVSAVISFHDDKRILVALLAKLLLRVRWIHINQANPYAVIRGKKGRLYYYLLKFSDEIYSVGEEAALALERHIGGNSRRPSVRVINVE